MYHWYYIIVSTYGYRFGTVGQDPRLKEAPMLSKVRAMDLGAMMLVKIVATSQSSADLFLVCECAAHIATPLGGHPMQGHPVITLRCDSRSNAAGAGCVNTNLSQPFEIVCTVYLPCSKGMV